ncbi:hypothetical protein [Halorhabdus rudnickae]|uniref:hypothetical protein n=1 Tax=Halorhabdus rudnickae TaxID=1775544 RepID=UPI001438642E|nr:hypothetical protein [Halorhabdus rudnickae]
MDKNSGRQAIMVSVLTIGAVLTLLAWIGLQGTVVHGKYVVDKIADGEYDKGPFTKENSGDSRE